MIPPCAYLESLFWMRTSVNSGIMALCSTCETCQSTPWHESYWRVIDSTLFFRLDFEEFDLDSGSSLTSPCDRDSLEILSTGMSDLGMGKLCGNNQDQHLYIPVINDRSQPMIRIMTEDRMLNVSRPYKYSIKVTQIDCISKDPLINALKGNVSSQFCLWSKKNVFFDMLTYSKSLNK